MQLSKRLQAIADFIKPCETLADVGCDHGYIPIYALENQIAKRAIATDVNKGPMERAASHIAEYGLEAYIDTRCADGLGGICPGEAQTVVIAGMGGPLMQRILTDGEDVAAQAQEFILQPQSEIGEFRCFLANHGYEIIEEAMVLEEEKYYTILHVVHGHMEEPNEVCREYGEYLLKEKNSLLLQYLKKDLATKEQVLDRLYKSGKNEVDTRVIEIKKEMQNIYSAFAYYEM